MSGNPATQTKYEYEEFENIETGYHSVRWHEPVIYELTRKGSRNSIVPDAGERIRSIVGDGFSKIPVKIRREKDLDLPELSEPEIMRHFLRLSQETFGYDSGITLGLGTCTMKYSPKINEQLANLPQFAQVHPLQPEDTIQGILQIMYELRNWFCELSGMDEFSFQPRGGSHGVYTNACIMRAYHKAKGNGHKTEVITSAVSHPCNAGCPATAGFKVIELRPQKETGDIGIDQLKAVVSDRTAGLMLTAPYDTGVFDSQLADYIHLVHEVGGLVSLDQANFNGVMTRLRAGDIGADMMHFNLHKTFSAPHGSAGPATGAIGVKKKLRKFLPVPIVESDGENYHLNYGYPDSIGKIGSFYGVVANVLKAYAWILSMGEQGLREAAEWAVINNNYLIKKLLEVQGVEVSWPNRGKLQEARFHLQKLKADTGIGSNEVNLRIGDYGIQTFFTSHEPVIISEPVTPEPTETISKEDIDRFVEIFRQISKEAHTNPEIVKTAPHRCAVHQTNIEPLTNPKETIVAWRVYKRRKKID
jgi:glycine dehydrogenase subunit 2